MQFHLEAEELNLLAETLLEQVGRIQTQRVSAANAQGNGRMGQPIRTAFRSPWQNGIAERWIGSVRRDLLDHVIVLNRKHLRRLLNDYVRYYNLVPYYPTSLCY